MKYFMLIWAGLWRKRARTTLTMLSVIVAFLLFGLLQGINQGIKSGVNDSSNNRLWTTSRMSQVTSMPVSLMDKIKQVKGIRAVTHLSFFGGYFQEAKNALPVFATNVDQLAVVYPELHITPAQIQAMKTTRTGALLGRALADQYHWKLGDKIPVGTTIWTDKNGSNSWSFDIVGIYDADARFAKNQLGAGFWINYDYWDEGRAYGNHSVHQYVSATDNPLHNVEIAAQIDKLTENSPQETRSQTENAAIQSQLKQLADINFITNAIVGAVMFTLLFLTGNTMMQSVRERIPELAVLKTLGFSNGTVCVLVLLESLLLCLFAALVGLALSTFAIRIVGQFSQGIFGSGALPAIVVLEGFAIAWLLAMVSGLAPALRAQRLNIVDALAGR
jgi:putative ABC transport system permease protein